MIRAAEHGVIERVIYSAANYRFLLVADLFSAVAFLALGIRRYRGSTTVACLIIGTGLLAWGGVEYGVHRWILHGPASLVKRTHARHHADGTALIGAPVLVSAALACATWAALSVPFGSGAAALAVFGLYSGYNYYAVLHHLEHQHRALLARVPYFGRLECAHRTHHHQFVANYGVSTTWWDQMLGTYQSSDDAEHHGSRRMTHAG